MQETRVLMISVSAGSGHVRAAEALLETSTQFTQITVEHIDVMDYVSRSFRGVYSDFYRHLINHAPAFWAYLYKKTDEAQRSDLSSMLRRLNSIRIASFARTFYLPNYCRAKSQRVVCIVRSGSR